MCQNACTRHKVLIHNLFRILSKENIELIQKIENVSQKTILRQKKKMYNISQSVNNSVIIYKIRLKTT